MSRRASCERHVKAVLRSGRVITEDDEMLGRASRPRRGDKAGPRRGLNDFGDFSGVRKDIAADSQPKTAFLQRQALDDGMLSSALYYRK